MVTIDLMILSHLSTPLYILFLSVDFLKGIEQQIVQDYDLTCTYSASTPNVHCNVDFTFNK